MVIDKSSGLFLLLFLKPFVRSVHTGVFEDVLIVVNIKRTTVVCEPVKKSFKISDVQKIYFNLQNAILLLKQFSYLP